jgi:cell wall-associated NlpC family hydrolase
MLRPDDLPSRTPAVSPFRTIQRCIQRIITPTCATSARITRFTLQTYGDLSWLPRRYFRHAFIGVSIPLALIAGSILPSAQQSNTTVAPVAAAYAVQSTFSVPLGDAPMPEADGAVAFSDDLNLIEGSGTVALGHEIQAPVRVGSTTDANVNLRRGPSTEEGVIAKLPAGTKLEVIGQREGWYRVATARGTIGWVSDDFFSLSSTKSSAPAMTAVIDADRTNLRQGPGTSFGSYGKMAQGTAVQVLARNGSWFRVRSPRGTLGWVHRDLIDINSEIIRNIPVTNDLPPAPKPSTPAPVTVAPAPRASVAASGDAVAIARQYVGSRYVWGGAQPSGFDCSGLTLYVYRQLGLNLPHKASLQYNTPGQRIGSVDQLAPGDLVFFVRTTSAKGITHVGIYTGNGRMVTAGTPRTGVQEVSLYNQYWLSRFAGGVRPSR